MDSRKYSKEALEKSKNPNGFEALRLLELDSFGIINTTKFFAKFVKTKLVNVKDT